MRRGIKDFKNNKIIIDLFIAAFLKLFIFAPIFSKETVTTK
jgi:hypothetical protein